MKCITCGFEFEGKFCPECGTPAPQPAICPTCGATVTGRFCAECGTSIATVPVPVPEAEAEIGVVLPTQFRVTQQCSPLQIDTEHKLWRVPNGSASAFGPKKPGAGAKLAKGTLAFMTMGMSVAAEAAVKGIAKAGRTIPEYRFDQLISFELLEDDEAVTSGGVGRALVGGALFGGFGAVAGGVTAKRKTKKVVNTLTVKLTINDFQTPCIMIPLLVKPIKVKSKEYEAAYNIAQKLLSLLDVITHNA